MALGNLSVRVTADVGNYTYAMDGVALTAKERMSQSSQAVEQFRSSVLQTSTDLQRAADAMGSNMEAANDAIVSSSQKSADAIREISTEVEKVDTRTLSEKLATAFGNGVGAGIVAAQTAINGFIEYTKTKAIVISAVIAAAFAAVGLGAVYTAYKVVSAGLGAVKDMMTGEFFKSENIDSVIKANNAIKDLQKSLQLSSIEAGALADALNRLGVDPGDYKTVMAGVTNSIHTNGEELDRLGVKYKDANGNFLAQEQILQNAKNVLDTYRAGWDRAQAAAAIGMGTYDQITQALKANSEQVGKSKERLDEYGLGMSKYGQEVLEKYQQTMREFDNENKNMADGFKRVISDAITPAYTALADIFKNGFPSLVSAFRVVVSSIVGLGYAMADGLYIAAKSVITALGIINDSVNAVDKALKALASGDLKGAGTAIVGVWESAKERVKSAGKDMVDVIMENDKKIKLATGADGRTTPIELARDRVNVGNVWVPLPKKPDAPKQLLGEKDDPARKAFEGYLKQQDDLIAAEKTQLATREQFMQSYYQQEYLTANEFYGRKIDLIKGALQTELDAYDREIKAAEEFRKTREKQQDIVAVDNKIADIERKKAAAIVEANKQIGQSQLELMAVQRQFDLQTRDWSHQRDLQNQQAAFNIEMMGRSSLEVQKLTEAYRINAETQERIYQIRKKDPNADVSGALAEAEKQKQIAMQMIQVAWDKQTSAAYGASEAIRQYGEQARNVGQQVYDVMTNAFRSMEDAFANFITTGKLNFKDLVNSINADIARMAFKSMMANAFDWMKGGGLGDTIAAMLKSNGASSIASTGSAVAGAATAAKGASDAAAAASSAASVTALGTAATTSSTALSTMSTAASALDTVIGTISTSFAAMTAAVEAATTALTSMATSAGVSSGASSAGSAVALAGAFADGGDPPVGRVSLVGERGPELFVPKQAGTIIPNDVLMGRGASNDAQQPNVTNHYLTVNVTPPAGSNASTAQQWGVIAGRQIQNATRRNG